LGWEARPGVARGGAGEGDREQAAGGDGGDPLAEKRKAQDALTFGEAVERYLEHKLAEFRNDKHRKQWRATLDTYAAPVLGVKPVAEIEVRDVLRVCSRSGARRRRPPPDCAGASRPS
jgi:hypothetical protein